MPANVDLSLIARFKRLSRLLGIIVATAGVIVLVGWLLNIPLLKSFLPELTSMKFNTALGFLLAGTVLILLQRKPFSTRERRIATVCALLLALLGLLTLSQYLFGWDFGIDQFLVQDFISPLYPGRMSPTTAFNFLLLGTSLFLLVRSHANIFSQAATLVAGILALLALVGYLYGLQSLYQVSNFTSLALHTTVTFILLTLGTLMAQPEQALMRLFVSRSAGGVVVRRLLPAAMFMSITLGWLNLSGQKAGVYDGELGLALFVLANVILLSFLVVGIAASLNRTDYRRLQAETALYQSQNLALEREKQLNQLQSRFLTIVSHEFRTPLAGILSSAELVQLYSQRMTEQRAQDHLDRIQGHVQYLTTLLDDVLTLSKAQTVGLEFNPTLIELEPFCRQIIQSLQVGEVESRISLIVGEAACPTISADYALLAQAITNLLTNALKYSSLQSTVWLTLACGDQNATLSVRDEGIGIPEDDLQFLFQLFRRASNVGAIPGTGLGLAIVKEAVEAHHGTVAVTSKVGIGTTLTLAIPLTASNG